MKTEPNCSSIEGHLVMLAMIVAAVALFTFLDVQISLARLDDSGPAAGAHLARPSVAYSFIPVLAACVGVTAIVLNFVLGVVLRRYLSRKVHWATLGGASSFVSIAQAEIEKGLEPSFAVERRKRSCAR